MRLSRLSNRQLKRLLARGEVRFGQYNYQSFVTESDKAVKQVQPILKAYTDQILKILADIGLKDNVRKELMDFAKARGELYKAWNALTYKVSEENDKQRGKTRRFI